MDQHLLLPPNSSHSARLFNSLLFLLFFSLLFNVLFLLSLKHGQPKLLSRGGAADNLQGLGWSRKAAEEAESAAAEYDCSGHGYVFADTINRDERGTPTCECNDCYTGPNCSHILPDCVADAQSGDPLFLEPFWIANAEAGATVVPAWYRMSYRISDSYDSSLSPQLEKQIRAIHDLAGNAVTQGRYIVIGTGSTQLINALIHSLSPSPTHDALNPAQVVAATPYYGAYETQTKMFDSKESIWKGDARNWIERTESLNSTTFIEFVTCPNNPDALLDEGVLKGENVRRVYDHAYYWPHFTAIPRPADADVMLFTLSKLTGHAGSRLGWAIVKDYDLNQKIYRYLQLNTLGVSHDTQLRATSLIKAIISGYREYEGRGLEDEKKLLFHYAYTVMRSRWQRLETIFGASDRFSLQNLEPNYCTFFRRVTGPSPAYAWVKCEREEGMDCTKVLARGGIIGRGAEAFGADKKRFVRLSLLRRHDNFALLERRLGDLVSTTTTTTSTSTSTS